MSVLVKRIARTTCRLCPRLQQTRTVDRLLRLFVRPLSSIQGYYDNLEEHQKFSYEQQTKLLNALNSYDKEELLQFKLSKKVATNLYSRKTAQGPFESLDDVLDVDGLCIDVLRRFCNAIDVQRSTAADNVPVISKGPGKIVTPRLDNIEKISSVTGIYLAPNGISWAKIDRSATRLECWDYFNFEELPEKLTPFETFKLARKVLSSVPSSYLYVLEGVPKMGPSSRTSTGMLIQDTELRAMFYALLNNSKESGCGSGGVSDNIRFLKSNVYQRLFGTHLGSDSLLTYDVITQMLHSSYDDEFKLPCSRIAVEDDMRKTYQGLLINDKELMGQALLMTVAFMDLCVYKNPSSLAYYASRNGKGGGKMKKRAAKEPTTTDKT